MQNAAPSVRTRLIILVIALALPMTAIAAAGAILVWNSSRSAIERELLSRAQAVAAGTDRELRSARSLLEALATSPYLDVQDLEGFHRQVSITPRPVGAQIRLADASGRTLAGSAVSYRDAISLVGNPATSRQVFESARPMVSAHHSGGTPPGNLIAIDVPVVREGRVIYDLGMDLPPAVFGRLAERINPPGDEWVTGLLDEKMSVVARIPDNTIYPGQKPPPEGVLAITRDSAGGVFTSPGIDGQPVIVAYVRLPDIDWVATAAIRQAAVYTGLWDSLLGVAAGGAALLLIGLLVALHQGRRIAGPVSGLSKVPPVVVPGGIREAEEVARSLAAASALRERSETVFRTLTDAMPQMVWSSRPDGNHDYFNRRWYELTGTQPEDTQGEACKALIHPDDRERVWASWQQSLASGEPYEKEYRLRMAHGAYRWILGRALPVRDRDTGAITRWFGTFTDIEDIIAARQTLVRSGEELERLVAARSRELEVTQSRLAQSQRIEALGLLAGGIAHDFNNVLQAVQSCGEALERRPGDAEEVRHLARKTLEAAERGSATTRRLLAFSRRSNLQGEPIAPGAMLSSMREILEHTIGTGIEIRVQADTGLPSLLADKAQLETVLVNLATNARDAMAGTGTLTLSAETRQHGGGPGPPDGLKAGSYVVLTVSDTGIGMDDATLARAPEPFFTTKPTGQGTGLGLAMAAGFAEQSGGGLFIESAPGSGTKVSLWLPVAGMPPVAAGSGLDVAPAISGAEVSARLLVVDDDAIVREGIAERMAAAGYDVLPVESGAVALAMLDAGAAVDMIVTDLSMPGMDGVRLIREAQIRRPGLPSILLTGFATTDESSSQDGKITVLHKPITGKQLAENVAALLARAARLG